MNYFIRTETSLAPEVITLDILVNGKPVKQYHHNGKLYVEAKKGSEFSIQLSNNSGYRLEAIIYVDGISILTGNPEPNILDSSLEPGFVIDSYSKQKPIPGWVLNNETSAKFVFDSKDQSLAKQTNKNLQHIGKITCVVFNEYVASVTTTSSTVVNWSDFDGTTTGGYYTVPNNTQVLYGTNTTTSTASTGTHRVNLSHSVPISMRITKEPDTHYTELGVSPGEPVECKYVDVHFSRNYSTKPAIYTIFYNTFEELKRMGIDLKNRVKIAANPTNIGVPMPKSWPVNTAL